MMKLKSSHLLTFLLFLLLVDKSLSKSGARSSLKGAVFKQRVAGSSRWYQTVETVEQQEIAPPPTKKIKGLSKIKEYFSNFGYLLSSGGPFNDDLDDATVSAIKIYQKNFNLKVTGDLTNETLHLVSLPRCGVPDIGFNYDVSKDNVSWPRSGNHWFPDKNLTYGFFSGSKIPSNATKAFRNAFSRWAGSVPELNLTETTYDRADIKVGFYDLDEGVEDVVWGESVIRLNASNAVAGEIRLDASKDWKLLNEEGGIGNGTVLDLESAAMHHIGHMLGLDHSNNEESLMYPYVLPSKQRKVELSSSDKESVRLVYSKGDSVIGGSWGVVRIVTTLVLGFAYYVVVLA